MQDKNTPTILIGYSGHGKVVAEAAILSGMQIFGYAAAHESEHDLFDLEYLGDLENPTFKGWELGYDFILGIGDNFDRRRVSEIIRNHNKRILKVVHPNASVSKYCTIGEGSFVANGTCINPGTVLGQDVIVNTGAIVDHDCQIADGSHIAPGAVLTGNVNVGQRVLIGANSVVKQGVSIGSGSIIGAGAVVVKDIPNGQTWAGAPAKRLR